MTYVQQNKRNLVIAAAAAMQPLPAAPAPVPAAPRRPRVRVPRPRRMTTRTLALATVAALIPVSVTATVVVRHATKASHAPIRSVGSDANGHAIRVPVVTALPAADARTWSALTRPPGDAERDPTNTRSLQILQDNSRFGLNAGLARKLTTRDGRNIWLMPGNGFVCAAMQPVGDVTTSQGCNTAADARAGALTTSDTDVVFGVVPDGVRSVTVTDAGTGLRHEEPVIDNVYELAYQPATVTLTVPGSAPVTFDVLQ